MAKVSGSIIIERPVDEVFDFVVDERNEPLYNKELLSSKKLTDGPIGVGTRFRAAHQQGRHPVEMLVEITDLQRPNRVASRTTMPWSEIEGEMTFEPVGTATRMRWAWDVHPRGLSRALTPLIGVIGRRSEQACWEGLRLYLESHQGVDR